MYLNIAGWLKGHQIRLGEAHTLHPHEPFKHNNMKKFTVQEMANGIFGVSWGYFGEYDTMEEVEAAVLDAIDNDNEHRIRSIAVHNNFSGELIVI